MQITAKQLAEILDGKIDGDPDVIIKQPGKIEEGGEGVITFLANLKYEKYIYSTNASAILVNSDFKPKHRISSTLIRVKDVYSAVAVLLGKFGNEVKQKSGIMEGASVHSSAKIGKDVYVGEFSVISKNAIVNGNTQIYPQVFIGENVKIGKNVILYPGVKIYHDCIVGDNCIIHANSVIGSDGFGFAPQPNGNFKKIAQIGIVIIEDDVEIGANTVIDRATMGSTIIRKGVKLDNLIQVAHNVEIGENTVIAAHVGIAGSTKLGKNCQIGGQTGFVGHIEVADGTKIQAQSGVASTIKEKNKAFSGTPAIPYNDFFRAVTVFKKLPEIYRKLNKIEKLLNEDSED